jgi:hypothetical protein
VQSLREEKVTLETQKKSLISRLRHVLTSQMELLDVLELDDDQLSKLKDKTKKVFSGQERPRAETTDGAKTKAQQATPEIVKPPVKETESKEKLSSRQLKKLSQKRPIIKSKNRNRISLKICLAMI